MNGAMQRSIGWNPERPMAPLGSMVAQLSPKKCGIAYGAGLRVGEIVMLRVSDIDSKRMLIRVEQGKGRKDRHPVLSPQLLELLRAWWLQCRSKGWLFPGRDPLLPITARQLNRVCHMAAATAGLGTSRRTPLPHTCWRAASTCV